MGGKLLTCFRRKKNREQLLFENCSFLALFLLFRIDQVLVLLEFCFGLFVYKVISQFFFAKDFRNWNEGEGWRIKMWSVQIVLHCTGWYNFICTMPEIFFFNWRLKSHFIQLEQILFAKGNESIKCCCTLCF